MAEFLDTTGVSYFLTRLITESRSRLYLISPYLKFNDRIREHLEGKDAEKVVDIRIVYGKTDLRPQESKWLEERSIRVSYCDNLHAKCYLNEDAALITSMNLYEFSQQNNNEMGIYIRKSEDPELYAKVDQEAKRLLKISKEVKIAVEEVPQDAKEDTKGPAKASGRSRKSTKPRRASVDHQGYCILCGDEDHPFDVDKPLCRDCYSESGRGRELDEFEDRVCHSCGEPHPATVARPFCYSCYKRLPSELKAYLRER